MESDTALLEFYAAYLEYLPLKNPKKLFKCSTKIAEELGEVAEATSALDGNAKKIAKIREGPATAPIEAGKAKIPDPIIPPRPIEVSVMMPISFFNFGFVITTKVSLIFI